MPLWQNLKSRLHNMATTQAPTTDMFAGNPPAAAPESAPPSTAVAVATPEPRSKVVLPDDMQQEIELRRMKNAMATQIRGTTWGKDSDEKTIRAVAEYCHLNGLDPVRHVEVLGGRIYLTAALYEDRGSPLIMAGIIRKDEPDYINVDERLEKRANAGDQWAIDERDRRERARIMRNAPEKAVAIVEQRLWVRGMVDPKTGEAIPVVGVNWCGGGSRQRDPVGDAEPTKTAETRAARRAWKQIVEIIPSFGQQFQQMIDTMATANDMLAEHDRTIALQSAAAAPRSIASTSNGGYTDLECRVPERAPVSAPTGEDPF